MLGSIQTSPFSGIGKPERPKHNLAGCWSRQPWGLPRNRVRDESGQWTVAPGLIQRLDVSLDLVRGALGRVAFCGARAPGI
ncbi:MAG: type II toxin-antitoxin system YoeB family toxin [Pseudomonadota bacterium]|nr:type II toxin-antitoxin system YoeB family toxin [Pseudomonadota bacterium]